MKVGFVASDKVRERKLARAFFAGVAKHGDEAEMFPPGVVDADIAVMFGVKARETFYANLAAGRHVVMIDKGYNRHRLPGARVWEYWRVAVDAHHPTKSVMDRRDTARANAMEWGFEKWRDRGEHIIIAGSSAKYHRFYDMPEPTEWALGVVAELRKYTNRPIVYRPKPSWKEAVEIPGTRWSGSGENARDVLRGAWATVTHGSNFCFESITEGVPCVILGDGVARPISSTKLSAIEAPELASDVNRRRWLCGLSYCQWTLPEFASGAAWAEIKRRI